MISALFWNIKCYLLYCHLLTTEQVIYYSELFDIFSYRVRHNQLPTDQALCKTIERRNLRCIRQNFIIYSTDTFQVYLWTVEADF